MIIIVEPMLAHLQGSPSRRLISSALKASYIKPTKHEYPHFKDVLSSARKVFATRHYTSRSGSLADVQQEQSDFLEKFIQTVKLDTRSTEHFSRSEWSRAIVEDEAYEAVPFFSRHVNERTGENRFFGQTVNLSTTIPYVLAFRRKNIHTPDSLSSSEKEPTTTGLLNSTASSPEIRCLMRLEKGLDSHPSIVNGGFQCVLFDETAWFVILVHQNTIHKPGPRDIHYTLSMNTKYFAPVSTPTDVLIRANLIKRDGRKWFTYAEIVDDTGKVLTSSESLWLTAKKA